MNNFFEEDEDEEMDMPCPCQKCGGIFDLTDGKGSKKWFPNTAICKTCHKEEAREIERDEEIEEALETIPSAEYDIKEARKVLEKHNYIPVK